MAARIPDAMKEASNEAIALFCQASYGGWWLEEGGRPDEARCAHTLAEAVRPFGGHIAPGLEVLRHASGTPDGDTSWAPVATERGSPMMMRIEGCAYQDETCDKLLVFDQTKLALHCKQIIETFDPLHHRLNASAEQPHVMVLSTGRCGTVSLWHLFKDSNLEPHHSYWWSIHWASLWWMQAALCEGASWKVPAEVWAKTRAAEWLGPKPMLGCSHLDTIFAPVFAAIHPNARFIYLHRNPADVFRSYYSKDQWSVMQLAPFVYRISDEEFSFHQREMDVVDKIAHLITFTETFARAFGSLMGDRFIEISADKLFAQDEVEIARLLAFTGSDIRLDQAVAHYGIKINEKESRDVRNSDEAVGRFRQAYAGLQQ